MINLFLAEILGRRGLGERKNNKGRAVLPLFSAVFVRDGALRKRLVASNGARCDEVHDRKDIATLLFLSIR